MLYESAGMTLSTNDGIATLRLHFPGRAINGLHAGHYRELETVLTRLASFTGIDALVIRSGRPDGFSTGLDPAVLSSLRTPFDEAAFRQLRQRSLNRLRQLPFNTLAFIEGPCLSAGWELALACDFRIAVAGPDSMIGPRAIYPRAGVKSGLLDDAFCQRRAKIELRGWVDRIRLLPSPSKGRRAGGEDNFSINRNTPSPLIPLPQRGEGNEDGRPFIGGRPPPAPFGGPRARSPPRRSRCTRSRSRTRACSCRCGRTARR